MAVNAGATALLAAALVAAYKRTLAPAAAATAGAMALIMVYWKQMVHYYDAEQAARSQSSSVEHGTPDDGF